jgi:hypothetical protein
LFERVDGSDDGGPGFLHDFFGKRLSDVGAGETSQTRIDFGDDCSERIFVAGAKRVDDG